MADPVSPEPQGNSISAAPGPQQTAPDPMAQPPTVQTPPGGFAPTTAASAGDAVKQYNLGVLQATAAGGMMQQKAFQESHQAIVDARTQAMGQAATRAGAVGGGDALTQALQARMGGGMDLRTANAAAHQADFTAASKQRDMNFSNYMKEVSAAIPLAQAQAQGAFQQKASAAKSASLQNQYETAVGMGQQQMSQDQAAHDQALQQRQPDVQKIQSDIDANNSQKTNIQARMAEAEKVLKSKGISIDASGLSGPRLWVGAATSGGGILGDPTGIGTKLKQAVSDWRALNDQLTGANNNLTKRQADLDKLNQDIEAKTPAPKSLSEYVQGLTGQGSPALQGKAALSQPALLSGQERAAKSTATSDVTRIMAMIPGIKVQDAKSIASNPDYSAARQAAQQGLTVPVDNRGRLQGTTQTPWEHLNAALANTDSSIRTAIIKEFETQYTQAGRTKQITAKQQTAKQ